LSDCAVRVKENGFVFEIKIVSAIGYAGSKDFISSVQNNRSSSLTRRFVRYQKDDQQGEDRFHRTHLLSHQESILTSETRPRGFAFLLLP
jgi:hypothetical protein